jgi:hypothetical protein
MRPNFPPQIAQRLIAPLQGYWELLRIVASCGLVWAIVGARPLFAVALRADVKNPLGIVMASQAPRHIGTS